MTPLLAATSARITFALPAEDVISIFLLLLLIVMSSPPTVVTIVLPFGMALEITLLGRTCLKSTAFRSSGLASRPFRASAGILAKASFVGAKTVKVPGPDRVSARPAAFTAANRVLNLSSPAAISAMPMVGTALGLGAGLGLE